MSEAPLVSVVIPTYNRRRCLQRAIESVLQQDCGPVEILVVDDASHDGTAEWVAKTYPRLALIRQPVNRGVAAARNAGMAVSGGRYIAFLDDDDWWDASFLRRHLDLLASRPDAVLSHCDFISVAQDGSSPKAMRSRELGADPVKTFLMENPIQSMTLVIMRRQALEAERGFREEYAMCEDRELYMRLLRHGVFVHVPRPLAYKTRSANSMTRNLPRWAASAQTLLSDFFAREESRPYRHLEYRARARWQARLALISLRRTGMRRLGMSLAVSALRFDAWGSAAYLGARVFARVIGA